MITKIKRPWGTMWLLVKTEKFWIKVIKVNQGGRTSLQAHKNRDDYGRKKNSEEGSSQEGYHQKNKEGC